MIRCLAMVLGAWLLSQAPARAGQSAVAAYVQQAFGKLLQTNCSGAAGANFCSVPMVMVVNTTHLSGASSFNSPPSGSVRYCKALASVRSTTLVIDFTADGQQLRSESSPPFNSLGDTCHLDINLNYSTLKFEGPRVGDVTPTVIYQLEVLNGMLVGVAPGFTSVIVFGTPLIVPAPR